MGDYIDRDKVPGTVQTLRSEDFTRTESPIVTDTLFQRTPGITLSDPNGNGAAQELSYRGLFASPLQGTPQGGWRLKSPADIARLYADLG